MTAVFPAGAFHAPGDSLQFVLTFDTDGETGLPERRVFDMPLRRDSVFFVISKIHPEHICVYEKRRMDTVLLAAYPCALSAARGQKAEEGDCRTPESWPGRPFRIWRISDLRRINQYSSEFRKYGPYYHALSVPGVVGIGIHGTNNPASIARGRASQGCIRMLNKDVEHMHDHYSQAGAAVIILPERKGPLPFEVRALRLVAGVEKTGCDVGCGPDCFRLSSPCERIHINPKLDIRMVEIGL